MILLPNFGFIFVDIKDNKQAEKYDKFFLPEKEVDKYLRMQRTFNVPGWFVLSHERYHYKTWFWIPASEVIRSGFIFDAKKGNEKIYSIPIDSFVQVSDSDKLDRIFTKLFGY